MIQCTTQLNVTKLLFIIFQISKAEKIWKIISTSLKTKDKISVLKYSVRKTSTDGTYSWRQLWKTKNISKQISPNTISLSSYQ